jgi:hypothetical protein
MELFSKIWGAGPSTSQKWIAKGYRTLHDLELSDALTAQQRIGLRYYYVSTQPQQIYNTIRTFRREYLEKKLNNLRQL